MQSPDPVPVGGDSWGCQTLVGAGFPVRWDLRR